ASQSLLQKRQRIRMLACEGSCGGIGAARRPGLDLHLAIKRLEAAKRSRAEEAVASHALAAHDAFEEKGPVLLLNLAESADRCQGVADQLTIDRDQAGVPGQGDKLLECRAVAHPDSPVAALVGRLDLPPPSCNI